MTTLTKTLSLAAALLLAHATASTAQKRGVVANAETGVPMRDVAVYANTGKSATTDWRGVYLLPEEFQSVTIVKKDFVSLTLNATELTDTVYLLPRFNTLAEVVVWGKRRNFCKEAVSGWQPSFLPNLPVTGGIGGLDILGLFRKKRPMSEKLLQKHREIMREY